MITVEGKAGVKAAVLLHSISPAGIPLITYELEYPRIILSELNTHGMLVKNSASSRAIPFAKMSEQLTGCPVRFGEANRGMQDKGEDFGAEVFVHRYMVESFRHWLVNNVPTEQHHTRWDEEAYGYWTNAENWWKFSGWLATGCSEMFYKAGYHKQVYNRLTEPFQMMKTVLSGTELENFFWLRNHGAADPTLHELARCMFEAREQSTPQLLKAGQWHTPYAQWIQADSHPPMWKDGYGTYVPTTWEDLVKISSARCAAVSFRNEDYGLERCREVFERLVGDDRKHASAMSHQATPMRHEYVDHDHLGTEYDESVNVVDVPSTWEKGISHMDRNGQLWSAQFRGWVMHRKLIPGENKTSN